MTPDIIAALRAKAAAATVAAPGRWMKWGLRGDIGTSCKGFGERIIAHVSGCDYRSDREALRDFIAACDPPTILALLDEIERLRGALWQGAEWFRGYEAGHRAKGDTDKADRNHDRAAFLEAALRDATKEKPNE